jgi:hypothetical protein
MNRLLDPKGSTAAAGHRKSDGSTLLVPLGKRHAGDALVDCPI